MHLTMCPAWQEVTYTHTIRSTRNCIAIAARFGSLSACNYLWAAISWLMA